MGADVGACVGIAVVGVCVGAFVGATLGASLGATLGAALGAAVGASEFLPFPFPVFFCLVGATVGDWLFTPTPRSTMKRMRRANSIWKWKGAW